MEDDVTEARLALADALARGDAAGAAALYADDARLLTAAADVIGGRRQIEAYWRAGLAVGLSGVELQTTELRIGDGIALELGRYSFVLDGDDGPVVDRGKYVALHRREADGAWRRTVDVFNPDAPGTARRPDLEKEKQCS
jgi:uncharacterized protein (TIGR02246 family)